MIVQWEFFSCTCGKMHVSSPLIVPGTKCVCNADLYNQSIRRVS